MIICCFSSNRNRFPNWTNLIGSVSTTLNPLFFDWLNFIVNLILIKSSLSLSVIFETFNFFKLLTRTKVLNISKRVANARIFSTGKN